MLELVKALDTVKRTLTISCHHYITLWNELRNWIVFVPFVVVSKLGGANDTVAVVSMTPCLQSGSEEAEFLIC